MAKGYFLVRGDRTNCGGVIAGGAEDHTLFGRPAARERDEVTCGVYPGKFYIKGGIETDTIHGRRMAGTLDSVSTCPCQARFVPSLLKDTYEKAPSQGTNDERAFWDKQQSFAAQRAALTEPEVFSTEQEEQEPEKEQENHSEPLPLPALIFATENTMDDYRAKDMHHGDLDEQTLKKRYKLNDISTRVNPWTGVKIDPAYRGFSLFQKKEKLSKEAVAAILFDEFRDLSDMFSFYGDYQGLIRKMITHMQYHHGQPFSDPLLDKALEAQILGDMSETSSLNLIKGAIQENIDWSNNNYPLKSKEKLYDSVLKSVLPKFNKLTDRTNGLVISVHDTWATHITLTSLEVTDDSFQATIHYRVQDHFGLDDQDISHPIYHKFRIFRIWFLLQHWEEYNYKPFITEMNVSIFTQGKRYEK
ncbi:PAAR domain-containing protein [Nissabacter archeti]|uniref:PAAR domain-containing protein n=1 Tax=Nissabacter archeti TaxID=1917880 RepID=A0ABS5JI12_9GAMM|nr:PAAR domain-containing protein [Nissabacter archeti]MBS0969577.1 PAAR domain-containing protein [Nissabacter archeti]